MLPRHLLGSEIVQGIDSCYGQKKQKQARALSVAWGSSDRSAGALALSTSADAIMPPPPPPPPTAAGAAAAAAVGDFGAKRHGYEGSLFHTNLLRLDDDPVSAWIEQRQRSFRDFEQSLRDPFTTVSRRPHPGVDNLFLPLAASRPKNAWKSQPQYAMLSSSRGLEPPSGDMSPKARVVYDDAKFQVEFDVPDYRPEELSIKTEGDVLIVLAKHETKTEDGGSFVSKQFEQRFTLPAGVRPENITSALSKGGTLTVTAPRESRPTRAINHESGGPSGGGGGSGSGGGHDGQVFRPHSREEGLPHPRVKYDEDRFQISLDCQQYRPEELDVKVEGSSIIITAKQVHDQNGVSSHCSSPLSSRTRCSLPPPFGEDTHALAHGH